MMTKTKGFPKGFYGAVRLPQTKQKELGMLMEKDRLLQILPCTVRI